MRDTNGHALTMLSQLNDEYTDVVDSVASQLPGPCEGMAMWKDEGDYFMVCSCARAV